MPWRGCGLHPCGATLCCRACLPRCGCLRLAFPLKGLPLVNHSPYGRTLDPRSSSLSPWVLTPELQPLLLAAAAECRACARSSRRSAVRPPHTLRNTMILDTAPLLFPNRAPRPRPQSRRACLAPAQNARKVLQALYFEAKDPFLSALDCHLILKAFGAPALKKLSKRLGKVGPGVHLCGLRALCTPQTPCHLSRAACTRRPVRPSAHPLSTHSACPSV